MIEVDRSAKVYVAGHMGLAGSAIWRHLERQGFTNLAGETSTKLDLRDRDATFAFFDREDPDVVIEAAGRVGGILANSTYPADFISDNLRMQVNVMDAARTHNVHKLLFLGSSCIYPKLAPQPIQESTLMTGSLEPTNDAYAIAKIAGILHIQAVRRQFGYPWISAMPTNLYGPGDNFHPQHSHVFPALIRRFHEAAESGQPEVVLWGTGTPRREFMHVDDLASAVLFMLENYDDGDPLNVGTGTDVSIQGLAEVIADVVGFKGTIVNDLSKPDGTPQKLLDVSRINGLGWRAQIPLVDGIKSTYEWFLANHDHARL